MKAVIYGAVFAGGVLVGLAIARQYARAKTEDAIHDALAKVGLDGGIIEELSDRLIVPRIAG